LLILIEYYYYNNINTCILDRVRVVVVVW